MTLFINLGVEGRRERKKFLGSIYILVLFLSILIFLSSLMLVAATQCKGSYIVGHLRYKNSRTQFK